MAVYLLNLTFDQAVPDSASGVFVDNSSDPTSKVWYTVPQTPDPWPATASVVGQGGQVQQAAALSSWGTPTSDSHRLPCALTENPNIYIRLAPRNGWGGSFALGSLRFTTVFGRQPGGNATIASPFVISASNAGPCTLYTTGSSNAGPDGSWIYYLGVVSQNAVGQKGKGQGSQNRSRFYSFIVGATVVDISQNEYTFGHDPGMDVTG